MFGDNVRARWAARALPRTPTHKKEKEKEEEDREDKQRELHTHHPPPFQPTHKPSPLFHNDTPLTRRHHPKQQHCDSKHTEENEEEQNGNTVPHTTHHTPPSPFTPHTTPHLTLHHATTHKAEKKQGTQKGNRTTRRCRTQPEDGDITAPRHSKGPPCKRKGRRPY